MSTHVISDLHGCLNEFNAMLEKTGFTDNDELWIIGDVIDRGKAPIPLLQKIMRCKNMHMLLGNHDLWLRKYAGFMMGHQRAAELTSYNGSPDLYNWLYNNGGIVTAEQFMSLSVKECEEIEEYLYDLKLYHEIEAGGKKYLLVHAGVGKHPSPDVNIKELPVQILLWDHIDIDDNPYQDVTMIVGHMPTFLYGDQYSGKIIHGKSSYHIDCGCVHGGTLGCIRLDDLLEYYLNAFSKDNGRGIYESDQ